MTMSFVCSIFFFFFQAEDGIRDLTVTGVQTCALPISSRRTPSKSWLMQRPATKESGPFLFLRSLPLRASRSTTHDRNRRHEIATQYRSEERRVGKEGRSRWSPYH